MKFKGARLSKQTKTELYTQLIFPRMIEEKMLVLLRQGKISKWFSGIGQEAISVGVTAALHPDEFILPMHRNLGVFTSRNIPFKKLFAQWQGKASGFTKGRDRSFHFGTMEYHILGMISHLGPQLGVADGIALGHKINGDHKVTAVFTGEGATSEGDFHEALNIAAVWDLPVLFCIENNGYGLSTPTSQQYRCAKLVDKAIGYGIEGYQIDGNNILEVYKQVSALAASVRERPRPILLEFITFRMRGHEEASGNKYVPKDLFEQWSKKDPVHQFEQYLVSEKILDNQEIEQIKHAISTQIEQDLMEVFAEPEVDFDPQLELNDVYAPWEHHPELPSSANEEMRFIDAVRDGLFQSLKKFDELVIMGQDIAQYGGAFKITEGFLEEFGEERIRNTPICESGIAETAIGLSVVGKKAVMELQFADFVSSGFNPIVNYAAKMYYRWGKNADVVFRMPCGAGVGAGPFHSQTNEAWFTKTPGLKVVYPSNPYDAKGLLTTAIHDPNPVMYFEHKALYRSVKGLVPKGYYEIPFGSANVICQGNQVSIVTFGAGVPWALDVLEKHPEIKATLIDLRTLIPLDTQTILESVRETGKLLLIQEDTMFGGICSDIAALVMEQAFQYLDAPVMRVGSLDTPIPFATSLEQGFLAKSRVEETLMKLLAY